MNVVRHICDHVLIPRVHGSISTEGKNSTSDGGGEGREVTVSGSPKARAVTTDEPMHCSPDVNPTKSKWN
jgi:hypothetical protein